MIYGRQHKTYGRILAFLLTVVTLSFSLMLTGCGGETASEQATQNQEKTDVNFFVLTGPTGVGAVHMMRQAEAGNGLENYHISAAAAPDEIVAKLSNGEADIAAVSTNLAATLYNKTEGGIEILAVNTLGVLYGLTNEGAAVEALSDLAGRTVYTTGKGANPEYILRYLLTENGIDPDKDLTIEYKADGSELTSVWATEPDAVIIAPQPVATAITMKYENAKTALDLTSEWEKIAPEDSQLMMGCVVARRAFIDEHPQAVENFLLDYRASVDAALNEENAAETAALCEQYGIVAKAAIAEKALPYCSLCFITGDKMKTALTGYLAVLEAANPASIGGAMPKDDFWYEQE